MYFNIFPLTDTDKGDLLWKGCINNINNTLSKLFYLRAYYFCKLQGVNLIFICTTTVLMVRNRWESFLSVNLPITIPITFWRDRRCSISARTLKVFRASVRDNRYTNRSIRASQNRSDLCVRWKVITPLSNQTVWASTAISQYSTMNLCNLLPSF